MKFGVHMFATDKSMPVDELAVEAEARNLESLWIPEHTHIPTNRATEWYRGRELPEEYARTLDPFVALTLAASATTTLRVATGVCLVAQHDPISLAKQVATLDLVSGGRFLFGIGLGWNLEEICDHGVDPATRRSLVREKVLSMKGLWTNERFGFDGRYVRFQESWQWPKPVQRPGPPVILGGRGGAKPFRHVVEYGDGWMPDLNMMRRERIPELVAELRRACEDAGRDPHTVPVSALGSIADAREFEYLALSGVRRVVYTLSSAQRDVVLPELDRLHAAMSASGLAGAVG